MDNKLQHYGILGMKWGVRRNRNKITPEQLSRTKGNVDNASNIVKESKNISTAVGNIKKQQTKQDLSQMKDEDLRARVNRMSLETQFNNLSQNQVSKGQSYVNNTLEIAGSALAITSSALGIALAIKQLKG